jgi:hypothetical protein
MTYSPANLLVARRQLRKRIAFSINLLKMYSLRQDLPKLRRAQQMTTSLLRQREERTVRSSMIFSPMPHHPRSERHRKQRRKQRSHHWKMEMG